jgi:hypothetical protein
MTRYTVGILGLAAFVVVTPASLVAHHGSASFETTKKLPDGSALDAGNLPTAPAAGAQ